MSKGQGFFMTDTDTSVCSRLADELSRLKKTHSFVADVCNVSTKTVGRWCKNVPIPADKLELLAPHGFDVLFVIYGVRFTSLERFASTLSEGASLDELISEFYKDVQIFRSKLTTDEDGNDSSSITEKSDTYKNLDQKPQTSISDPSSAAKLGSDLETDQFAVEVKSTKEKSATYSKSDQISQNGSGDPILEVQIGSEFSPAELSDIGEKWWDVVSNLSETQREAILTLVFNHVIAKFIEINKDNQGLVKHKRSRSLTELLSEPNERRTEKK
jgi:hypothetical protein